MYLLEKKFPAAGYADGRIGSFVFLRDENERLHLRFFTRTITMDLSHVQRVRMLYKTILKLHRGLPVELQVMGNSYTREEFKRHKTCNVAEAKVFMVEWANYAVVLAEQLGLKRPKNLKELGQDLHPKKLDQMRDDQIVQLYELFEAAKNMNQEDAHKEND